jgi:hypothetical protein
MAKSVIKAGVCGFTTEVVAKGDMMECEVSIKTDCPSIEKLAPKIEKVEPMQEIGWQGDGPLTLRMYRENCPHPACPVPCGIIKAVEVEAGLALPKDASITVRREND